MLIGKINTEKTGLIIRGAKTDVYFLEIIELYEDILGYREILKQRIIRSISCVKYYVSCRFARETGEMFIE